jgi:hypothetical protein
MKYIVTVVALGVGLCTSTFIPTASQALSALGATTQSSGYKIPHYGSDVKIGRVFEGPTGTLVLNFIYTENGKVKSDYYDTAAKERLFPNQESELANSVDLGKRLESAAGLKQLLPTIELALRNGTIIDNRYLVGGTLCVWPYSSALHIDYFSGRSTEKIIAIKKHKPTGDKYYRPCRGPDFVDLVTKYKIPGMGYYSDGRDGFWAQVEEYFIHFDANGNSSFFDGRDDVVLVNPAQNLTQFGSDSLYVTMSDQTMIDKSDTFLDGVGRQQKRSSKR